MTVCAAAFAANASSIVCIADKAVTYGEYIQWDSDSTKMLEIKPTGTVILESGDEETITRILNAFRSNRRFGLRPAETLKACEREYKRCLDDLLQKKFLNPQLLTRKEYVNAVSGGDINPYIESISDKINEYRLNCDLLICGFDKTKKPFIFNGYHPGIVTDMSSVGFHAVGSGSEKAVSRLLFSSHERSHPVGRVLYDAFDAKVNAELAVGVGYEWDAWVLLPQKRGGTRTIPLPKEVKELIERVWGKFNRSPFEKREKDDIPEPPQDWKGKLEKWVKDCII